MRKPSTAAIFSLMKHHKAIYAVDLSVMLLSNAAEALVPLFFGLAVGAAIDGGDFQRTFWYLLTAYVLNLVHMVSWHSGDYWVIKNVHANTYKLRDIAYRFIWRYEYARFIDRPSSKIAASANRLQENLRYLYDSFHYGFFSIGVYYVTLTLAIAPLAWQNSVIYLVFTVAAIAVLAKRAKKITGTSATFADKLSEIDGKVFDSVANYTNVFSFNAKRKEITKNSSHVKELFSVQYKREKTVMDFWTIASFMMRWVLWAAILGTNFYLLKTGQIDQSGFAAAIAVMVSFTGQYWNLVHHISEFGSRMASFAQNYDYLFDKDIVNEYYAEEKRDRDPRPALNQSLELHSVSFAYPDAADKNILDNISFTINHKEKIGIVGHSGGGKSTLVKLLLGFYAPSDGQVRVDDRPISQKSLSQLVSYVPQDTTLFQESIAYNIGYAVGEGINREQVVRAAKKAHAHDFIMGLKNGYDTLVGERGVKLSLGQRQRIALARAFLKNTALLILDEATSSLDSKTEKDIQDSLELLWHDKTVIAIAHRLSTLNNVDRILVVDNGRIIESGTKDSLLKQNGKFKELWDHQKNGLI